MNIFFLEAPFGLQKSKGTLDGVYHYKLNSIGHTKYCQKATRTIIRTDIHISLARPHWGALVPSSGDKFIVIMDPQTLNVFVFVFSVGSRVAMHLFESQKARGQPERQT